MRIPRGLRFRLAHQRTIWRPRWRRLSWPLACAGSVSPSLAFARRELLRREEVGRYRLRGASGLALHIRHPYHDMWVFGEIFRRGAYRIPAGVREALRALGRSPRILDLGGHVGLGALYLLTELPDAEITSFEPDPDSGRVLRETIAANDLGGRWEVVEAAAGTAAGSVSFVSDYHLSRVVETPGEEGIAVPVVDALPYIARADLVKIDVQGGEWALLGDPRFHASPPLALVLEYHPSPALGRDAHATARHLLEGSDFTVGPPRDEHGGEGTLWALRGYASARDALR